MKILMIENWKDYVKLYNNSHHLTTGKMQTYVASDSLENVSIYLLQDMVIVDLILYGNTLLCGLWWFLFEVKN